MIDIANHAANVRGTFALRFRFGTADTRIYAVGDIHGRADLLSEIIARIDDDIRRRPIAHTVEVYLGDYVDRGPHSSTVLDLLAVRLVANRAVCLRGNHEAVMEGFLQDPGILEYWLPLGGMQTLASYGDRAA